MSTDIKQRKADHLDLCATDAVAFKGVTTLLEHVRLVHQSLPDLHLDEIDLSVELLGKTLKAPIFIAGMTGGHERAAEVNHTLAKIANDRGYGFGLGSQRAMQKRPDTAWTFQVREHAPPDGRPRPAPSNFLPADAACIAWVHGTGTKAP